MLKKRNKKIKKQVKVEFDQEFYPLNYEQIEENVLKLIKKTNNSSKKH